MLQRSKKQQSSKRKIASKGSYKRSSESGKQKVVFDVTKGLISNKSGLAEVRPEPQYAQKLNGKHLSAQLSGQYG
jgi:hypothetical protein